MLKSQDNYNIKISNFEDFILTVYVLIDDLYQQFAPANIKNRRNVFNSKLSDSEIITISICGELAGIDSEKAWYSFVKRNYKNLFPEFCRRTRFNRTRRALMQVTELLRQKLLSVFGMICSPYFIVDSFLFLFVNLVVHVIVILLERMELIMVNVLLKKKLILVTKYTP